MPAGQLLLCGPREFGNLSRRLFYAAGFALALGTAFGAVLATTLEFDNFDGAYSAFGQNLMMSVLFVTMLYSRGSLRGQNRGNSKIFCTFGSEKCC